jgi:hypothetical protein
MNVIFLLLITKQFQGHYIGTYGVPLQSAPFLLMGIGSRHKTKGQIWLHHCPQHGFIGTARWQKMLYFKKYLVCVKLPKCNIPKIV